MVDGALLLVPGGDLGDGHQEGRQPHHREGQRVKANVPRHAKALDPGVLEFEDVLVEPNAEPIDVAERAQGHGRGDHEEHQRDHEGHQTHGVRRLRTQGRRHQAKQTQEHQADDHRQANEHGADQVHQATPQRITAMSSVPSAAIMM